MLLDIIPDLAGGKVKPASEGNDGMKMRAAVRIYRHRCAPSEKQGAIPIGNFIKANEKIIPKIKEALMLNKSAIIEGNFYHKKQLEHLINALEGEKVYVFTLKAKLATCIDRDKKRQNPYGKKATEAVYKLVSKFNYGTVIDTENKTEKEVVEELKKRGR